jgi:hypothetical protein
MSRGSIKEGCNTSQKNRPSLIVPAIFRPETLSMRRALRTGSSRRMGPFQLALVAGGTNKRSDTTPAASAAIVTYSRKPVVRQ